MKQSVTVGAQLLRSGRYGCNNGRYGWTIVMSYIEINKAVSQWLLTFNLCVSVTWPLTCAFHIPCTHTPEIVDMPRGMCDNGWYQGLGHVICARNRYQGQGQVITPHSISGMRLLVHALDTLFWLTSLHVCVIDGIVISRRYFKLWYIMTKISVSMATW